jgi:Zn-dependent protease
MSGLDILAVVVAVGIGVIVHEVAHGWTADKLGDPTARLSGRLTLNPFAHFDLWGTFIFPIFLLVLSQGTFTFGWAKPVPVNPYNLRRGRRDMALVAIAGPLSNLLVATLAGLAYQVSPAGTRLPGLFGIIVLFNLFLMMFNVLPLPPLDGSKIALLFAGDDPRWRAFFESSGFWAILGLLMLDMLAGGAILRLLVFAPASLLASFLMNFPFGP